MQQLDRTAFKRQSVEGADDQRSFWKNKTMAQRLEAARRLNAAAWRFLGQDAPRMNKQVFKAGKRMSNELFYQDFLEFIQALNEQEVEYVLVGGYAVILHGYPRTTGDLDIWVRQSEDNYRRLERAFAAFGMPVFDMTLDNFMDRSQFDVFTFGTPPVSIDLMTRVKGLIFEEVYEQAEAVDLGDGLSVRLISLDDLLRAKRASGRSKDFNDIRHLSREE